TASRRPAGALRALGLLLFAVAACGGNPVVTENGKAGNSDWLFPDEANATAQEVEGYASATSVGRGQTLGLYVNAESASGSAVGPFAVAVYGMGWCGGAGAGLVRAPIAGLCPKQGESRCTTAQPPCPVLDTGVHDGTHVVECNWYQSYGLVLPSSWISGVYLV